MSVDTLPSSTNVCTNARAFPDVVRDAGGGHFGLTDAGVVEYHYHATPYTPYHLACQVRLAACIQLLLTAPSQGPALSKCDQTQHGVNFCGQGCGADVCIQPGTPEAQLCAYLDRFNSSWFDAYTNNLYY